MHVIKAEIKEILLGWRPITVHGILAMVECILFVIELINMNQTLCRPITTNYATINCDALDGS